MRSLPAAVIVLLVLASPAGALAEPPPVSAVSQYVETIPTGDGGGAAGPRGDEAPTASVPLPAPARTALVERGGEDAKQLEALATRPEYGAPARTPVEGAATGRVEFAPVSAALAAVADSSGTSLVPLFVGMALIALATVLAAGRARD